ncbi:Response regulator PleD [Planctomycetes bacterium MalM25]|nr:Response regulator PleD [Planctomycetes bacterium MalM25]
MDIISLWGGGVGLPETVALAAVAVIGYVFGRRRDEAADAVRPEELVRAAEVARQLETVAASLRNDLAAHRAEVERFKHKLRSADGEGSDASRTLQDEAERILEPTLRLVGQVASAYDQIRRQSRALADFSGGRTDELTGLCNRRALSELLGIELCSHEATGGAFSIAVLGLEAPEGEGSRAIQQERVLLATELLRPQLRETDLLARYGLDEFVVVMPNTRLFGASRFGKRVREAFVEAGLTVSCGLTQSQPDDTASTLLGRADSALYSAKATAAGEQFLHNGSAIRNDVARPVKAAEEPSVAATA